jgi:hypothetical protein
VIVWAHEQTPLAISSMEPVPSRAIDRARGLLVLAHYAKVLNYVLPTLSIKQSLPKLTLAVDGGDRAMQTSYMVFWKAHTKSHRFETCLCTSQHGTLLTAV